MLMETFLILSKFYLTLSLLCVPVEGTALNTTAQGQKMMGVTGQTVSMGHLCAI